MEIIAKNNFNKKKEEKKYGNNFILYLTQSFGYIFRIVFRFFEESFLFVFYHNSFSFAIYPIKS